MRAFVAGGAGFIGSHIVGRLLKLPEIRQVTVYDNFSSGRREYLPAEAPHLRVVHGDLSDSEHLRQEIGGHEVVFHFASNPDIARAAREPDIDFWQGTYLTQNVLEAMRHCGVRQIIYASGSGVYGDTGPVHVQEDYAPLLPISTYGASKLACEALICAYCHMFGLNAWVFRFANVVGPRQTHGVMYDFVRRLSSDPGKLTVLGDGNQSKPYIHVDDVLDGIWLAWKHESDRYNYFNVATDDHVTVAEIASLVVRMMGLLNVRLEYTGGSRGWAGDVPVVRMDTAKLKRLGWRARYPSIGALERAGRELLREVGWP